MNPKTLITLSLLILFPASALLAAEQASGKPPNVVFFPIDEKSGMKYIMFFNGDSDELYNIQNDIGETTDLIAKQPEAAKELNLRLVNFLNRYYAKMPAAPAPFGAIVKKRLADEN